MREVSAMNPALLVRCYEGMRNWRALVLLLAGFVIEGLLAAAGVAISSHLGPAHPYLGWAASGLFGLLAILVLLACINGAGLLLIDQADRHRPRNLLVAFAGGFVVMLKALLCLIVLGIGVLLLAVILWALSLLVKVPAVGPVFAFLLAGPTMVVLAFCFALLLFGGALMLVALWRGNGPFRSIRLAIDIVVKRPLDLVLHFIVLALLIVPVEAFAVLVLAGGGGATVALYLYEASGGLAALAGGNGGGTGNLMSSLMTLSGSGGLTTTAAGGSIALVLALVWGLFVLVTLLGYILVFDSLAGETAPAITNAPRAAASRQSTATDLPHPPMAGAPVAADPAPPPLPAAPPPPAPHACRHCGAPLSPGDQFCGACGKLQTA